MNPDLKLLLEELIDAIDSSDKEDSRVGQAIETLRKEGYGINIKLQKINDSDNKKGQEQKLITSGGNGEPRKIEWTDQDCKFLRALKIEVESAK